MSTFYSLNPASDLPFLHGFWTTLSSLLCLNTTITVEAVGDILDETTGVLTGAWSETAVEPVVGTSDAQYAAPAGAVIIWETGVVQDAHRLRGKTYVVPLAATAYAYDGSLTTDALTTVRGAADSLAAANDLVVWHRPRSARAADGSRPAVTARAGGYANITAATVHDFVAILTSRRD